MHLRGHCCVRSFFFSSPSSFFSRLVSSHHRLTSAGICSSSRLPFPPRLFLVFLIPTCGRREHERKTTTARWEWVEGRDNRREALVYCRACTSEIKRRSGCTTGFSITRSSSTSRRTLLASPLLLVLLSLFCFLLLLSDGAIKMFPRSLLPRG